MDTPQTHYEKLVEAENILFHIVEEEYYALGWVKGIDPPTNTYQLWRGIADHLLYYDSLTNPS